MTGFRMQRTLRTRIVDQYRELPLAFHRAHPTGELIAHAESDVDAATEVLNPLPWSTAVVLLMVFAAIELVLTDPFLAVIGISVLPGLAVMNRFYTRRVEGPAARIQERIGEVSSVAHESIDGALVVKVFARQSTRSATSQVPAGNPHRPRTSPLLSSRTPCQRHAQSGAEACRPSPTCWSAAPPRCAGSATACAATIPAC